MFFRKPEVTWKILEPRIKKALVGNPEVFSLAEAKLGTISLKGVAVVLIRIVNGTIEVSVSLDCSPILIAKILAGLDQSTKWHLSYNPFIHAENGDVLWGEEAQSYYSSREILLNSIPGMVFMKEHLC